MPMHRSLFPLIVVLALLLPSLAGANDRAAAFEAERRWFLGIGGATSQSRFRADSAAGGNTNSLSDTPVLRIGRYGRPARYGIDLMRVRYDEAEVWYNTAFLDYVIPGGEIFSGYAGLALGWGHLRWRRDSLLGGALDFNARGENTTSWLAGLRFGGLIEVTELVQVEIGYRYLFTDFSDRFSADGERVTVEGTNQRAVHAGVNFRF